MNVVVSVGMILSVPALGLLVIARWDKPVCVGNGLLIPILSLSLVESLLIQNLCAELSLFNRMVLGIFAGCLLLACITDSVLCQVHNFVWWLGLAAGGILLTQYLWQQKILYGQLAVVNVLTQLFAFTLLQFFVFGRTYGRADCYAFCVCAIVEAALGLTMEGYLLHMILSYLILILVQALRQNISARGRLKRPIPFLPYINLAFWVAMILLL